MNKTRPALIVSNDVGNRHSTRVIVAPITSSAERVYPFEVFLEADSAGLKTAGKILLDQVRSIDKQRLGDHLGRVSAATLQRVDAALHVSFGLRC